MNCQTLDLSLQVTKIARPTDSQLRLSVSNTALAIDPLPKRQQKQTFSLLRHTTLALLLRLDRVEHQTQRCTIPGRSSLK